MLALLGDIVMAPSFPEAELATRKGEVITAIRQDEDNPAVRAVEALMALLYPDGASVRAADRRARVEIVERLTRDQLLRLHAERFAPERADRGRRRRRRRRRAAIDVAARGVRRLAAAARRRRCRCRRRAAAPRAGASSSR